MIEKLTEVSGYNLKIGTNYDIKWYSHEENIIKVSKLFPAEMIVVDGEGEERDDFWTLKCKDGVLIKKRGQLIFPSIDDSELLVGKD